MRSLLSGYAGALKRRHRRSETAKIVSGLDGLLPKSSRSATTVVADSKYGTVENFLACYDREIHAPVPDLGEAAAQRNSKRKIFAEASCHYDPDPDTYRCPAGQLLKPRSLHVHRQSQDYAAPKKVCAACQLREQCTQNKTGRTIKRHLRQAALDTMRQLSHSAKAKRDLRTRQHLMERFFARSARYGFDHARWRGLWRVRIQEYLTCAIQNIEALLRYGGDPTKKAVAGVESLEKRIECITLWLSRLLSQIPYHLPVACIILAQPGPPVLLTSR